jgi:hypothetical protein
MLSSHDFVLFCTQCLPVVLIILYFLYPVSFRTVSDHPLGKLIAISLIMLYSYQDIIHGIVICLLVIIYYHQQVEEFISDSGKNYAEYLPKPSDKNGSCEFENHLEKDFLSIEDAYPSKIKPIKKVSESLFRKERCAKDTAKVHWKGETVKTNLIRYVYPELQYNDSECNPCDRTCHFTIQQKQQVEEQLQTPKSSKDTVLWDMISALTSSKDEPIVIYQNQVASIL